MKGKKAAQAANRRDRDELVKRAEQAERRAGKAERDLADLQETHKAKVAELLRQRDEAASPARRIAESQVADLTDRLTESKAQIEAFSRAYEQLRYILLGLYKEHGYAYPDTDIAVANLTFSVGADALIEDILPEHEKKRVKQGINMVPVIRANAKKRGRVYSNFQENEIEREMRRHINVIASYLGPIKKEGE